MSSSTTKGALVDVVMPQMGSSVTEGTIVEWNKAVGDEIACDETICEVSTDKIDTECPSPVAGFVAEILVDVGQTVEVGTVLARIQSSERGVGGEAPAASDGGESRPDPQPAAAAASAPRAGMGEGALRVSPVVARIAAEHDVDLSQVAGTGRGGRIRKPDVLAYLQATPPAERPLHIESPYKPEPPVVAAPAPHTQTSERATGAGPDVASSGPLSRMRKSIGEHMLKSLQTAAQCTTVVEVDITRIDVARRAQKMTYLPYVSRCVIAALREYPLLNSTLADDVFTTYEDINLGIAVSLGQDGLIVPVIANAQELSVEGLSARIKDIAGRARNKQLSPDDVVGATFTITNPGAFGAIMATPIINQPQIAILDLETVVKRPVVVTDAEGHDSIAIRSMTYLCLSWDHRAMDGVLAAQFLSSVKRHMQAWDTET